MSERLNSDLPLTLSAAHAFLRQERPHVQADRLAWLRFHRRSAEIYASTAKTDVLHKKEAIHCAGVALRQAREIEDRFDPPAVWSSVDFGSDRR